ncbi:MAG: bifunctional adenosylcobinamide kinase/adenosylcobinamide-phosphate guanylyltransferase, partial [Cetobacterium sp.]
MGKIIYVTGGARSGKSCFAEKKVFQTNKNKIYIATGIAFDEEMKSRVNFHKIQRGEDWKTIESYKNLPDQLESYKMSESVVLLDCLTNFVTNNMILDRDINWDNISQNDLFKLEEEIKRELQKLIDFIKESLLDIVIVSNEVGMGLVPEYPLGRYFRDIAGRMNQLVAKESHEAYLIVSG